MNNESGFHPIEDRVLIKTIEVEKKSAGGIVLPDSTKDAEDMAQIHGHFVAGGKQALTRMAEGGITPGDLVAFAKYAGHPFIGKDGAWYRVMNAQDVIGKSDGYYDKSLKARQPMQYGSAA